MKTLDIGCGNNKHIGNVRETVIGMDKIELPGVDTVHDMEQFPYPFAPMTFNTVIMHHSLEHVSKDNNITIIEEVHRILVDGGLLIVDVPIGQWFHFDPTHKNYVCSWYWKYFSNDFPLNYYTNARFELVFSKLVGIHGLRYIETLTPVFNKLYQLSPEGMERFINFINLDAAIQYILRKC